MKRILSFSFLSAVIIIIIAGSNIIQAQVTESWASRYNGPGSGTDQSNAIVVDNFGNIYVTGYSSGSGTNWDYSTIKYDSAGVQQWVQRYNGPGNFYDVAYAISADDLGFIYVTGGSYGSSGNYDFLTIKYSSSGDTVWTRRYNGPRNALDKAYAIVLDDTGNVYITGESEGSTGTHGIFEDYATIKYSTDGTFRWVARYNGPIGDYDRANAITIDDSGNVYVTGTSDGGSSGSGDPYFDYATLKYNNRGDVQWIKRYKGFGTSNDEAKAIEVDITGNVFVTGFSYGNYLTIKYNFDGDTLWTRSYNGPDDYTDKANDLAIDDLGNVYVTGSSYGGIGTNYDYATIKYNSDGDSIWVNRYNGPDSDIDEGISIARDKLYNVYVTGRSTGFSYDYATIKYDSAGDESWVERYSNGGSGSSSDEASALYVDTLSNVYVTGMSALDYATVKYVQMVTSVDNSSQNIPDRFILEQNYPNPFNPSTTIHFSVPSSEFVTLKVFDVLGNEVTTLINEEKPAGVYEVNFSASQLTSGVYFYTINAGSFVETKKMILLK
jgi:hypothetical protein